MSKGSKRRPTFIKDEEYRINYEKIYNDRRRSDRDIDSVQTPEGLDRASGRAGKSGLKKTRTKTR